MKFLIHLLTISYIYTLTHGFLTSYHCSLDCGGHGRCDYRFSTKYCRCNSGYTGDRCQKTDVCDLRPCKHSGRCQNTDSSPYFKCTCNYGYLGDTCEQDHCVSSPCQNGGHCAHYWRDRFYRCTCNNGFSGRNCEVSPCSSNPCRNGGVCLRLGRWPYFQCTCLHGFTGKQCENAPATGTLPMASSTSVLDKSSTRAQTTQARQTTPTTVITTLPNIKQSCSKFSVVFDLAEKIVETNPDATICQSGNHSSSEAFVLNNCGFTSTSSVWKQGYNVMTWCDKIPPYTPVASFPQGKYVSSNSISGIFIGCLVGSSGFTLAVQECDRYAHIEHVLAGNDSHATKFQDFFTIDL